MKYKLIKFLLPLLRCIHLNKEDKLALIKILILNPIAKSGEGFESSQDSWGNQLKCANSIFKQGLGFASKVAGMVRRGEPLECFSGLWRLA